MRLNKQLITFLAAICLLTGVVAITALLVVSVVRMNMSAPVFSAALAFGVASVVTGVASRVLGLIVSAGRKRWDWFVAVLLLGAPASLALGLASSDELA